MIIADNSNCKAFEVDFIGVSNNKAKQDADAICFRWRDIKGNYKIGIYDAGFQPHAEAMLNHLNKYYFNDIYGDLGREKKYIDYLFVSHPHNDHASGVPIIIENFSIGCVYMNIPWLYTEELMRLSDVDGRTTMKSLKG